jgi:hypothetical protein
VALTAVALAAGACVPQTPPDPGEQARAGSSARPGGSGAARASPGGTLAAATASPAAADAGTSTAASRPPVAASASGTPAALATGSASPDAVASSGPVAAAGIPVRDWTEWRADRSLSGQARVDQARAHKLAEVAALFRARAVAFPPPQLLWRVFKREGLLEVWAASRLGDPLVAVTSYRICYASGELGPKRREGDLQVPEGFYRISFYNPASSYHLAMLVDYPNTSDRILGDRRAPGGEIMIHGSCVSVGCIAMSDERVEELWLMARGMARPVHVHIFPTRDIAALLASGAQPEHHDFWRNLADGYASFERTGRLSRVRVDRLGRYVFGPG